MKNYIPSVLFILFNVCIVGGTASRACLIHPASGRERDSLVVNNIALSFPNPLCSYERIAVTLESDAYIYLCLYNIIGRSVAVLADGYYSAGTYSFCLDGRCLSNDIYFLTVNVRDAAAVKKVIYLGRNV